MAALETDKLAELIRRKRTCLKQLHEVGQRQLQLIAAGDMAALMDLLATKQRLLGHLTRVERALDPFRGEDPERRDWRTADDRRRCAEVARQCDELLADVVHQDRLGQDELARGREEAAKRLQGVHLANLARGAYTTAPQLETNQLDLLSDG